MPIDHLPRRLCGPAERIRDGLLTDATALVILGAGMIARGISYSDIAGPGPSGHPAESWMTMGTWSIVWVAVGVLCLTIAPCTAPSPPPWPSAPAWACTSCGA
ncbi:hypothetical protein [Corynebacterium variabile]|uniref:Uncharacterized protein n=1 Tax=Corynebacterium variabile TaxID=1727 RepID=A0A0X2NLU7_9CORY|nr:hypothetical protein [Corynebacterium variabile]MDN6479001.1 hypothetical protein [Corynebacterium variabile]GEC86104.1 hypothetical protein CVA01_14180 [Corynebacterium variabile]CUU66472.1 hypothetical protein CVAR292_01816 [Corynebacterium variabile]